MKQFVILLILAVLVACQSAPKRKASNSVVKTETLRKPKQAQVNPVTLSDKVKLLGVWKIVGAGEDENANFMIKDKEFYYTDAEKGDPYQISKDSIVLTLQDGIERLKFRFKGNDTLTLISEDGPSTYFRVKN